MTHLLYDPLTFPVNAPYSRWRFGRNPEAFGGQGGLTQKYGAVHRDSRPPLRGIVKTEWTGTILADLLWSRLARLADLPAAPVQLVSTRRAAAPFNLGALVWVIEDAEPAPWLWRATLDEMKARDVREPETVANLKAFVLWTSGVGANELGEFMVERSTRLPFVIDHQDSLFIASFGVRRPIAADFPAERAVAYLPDPAQRQLAREFWADLGGRLRSGLARFEASGQTLPPILDVDAHRPFSFSEHVDDVLQRRDPGQWVGALNP